MLMVDGAGDDERMITSAMVFASVKRDGRHSPERSKDDRFGGRRDWPVVVGRMFLRS